MFTTCTLKYSTFLNVDLRKLSSPFISTAKKCIETWLLVADLFLLTVTD